MEDALLQLRLLRDRNASATSHGIQEAVADVENFSEEATSSFLAALGELIKGDVEESKNADGALELGTLQMYKQEAYRSGLSLTEPLTAARAGHFAYALLDLLQKNLKLFYSETLFKTLVDMLLQVSRSSLRSFLRCKSFEVLISIGKLEGVGVPKVEREVEQTVKSEPSRWSGSMKKIPEQWRGMKHRAGEVDKFRAQLFLITVDYPPVLQVVIYVLKLI